MTALIGDGAWNPTRVSLFKEFFFSFLDSVTISSKERGQIKLGDNIYNSQKIFYNKVWECLENDIHDLKVGKARQLGLSSATRPLSTAWMGCFPGMQYAMVYDTDPHKEEARVEIESIIDSLPKKLKFPRIVRSNRSMIQLSNGSVMRLLSAGVRKTNSGGTLGRSSGINGLHCSEMCSWDNTQGVQALKASLAETYQDRLYIWESTARGFNQWYEMWEEAKADDLNQQTLFLGWFHKEAYMIPQGTRLFERYGTSPHTEDERKRIALVKKKYDWDITPEQLAWWRRKVDPTREREADEKEDGLITQDFPWDEDEMFQSTGSTFFNADKLTEASKQAANFKFKPYKFWPGATFIDCEIAPVKTYRETDVKIFEEAQPDSVYIVAGDPAYGYTDTNDRAACQVLKCYADKIEQVAEAASPNWHPEQFAYLMLTMVGYYGMEGQNEIQFVLEKQGGGEATLMAVKSARKLIENGYLKDRAREHGLQNLFTNFRNYIYKRADSMSEGNTLQYQTTVANKVPLMERFRDFVHNGTLLVRSYDTLAEMKSIAREGNVIKAEGSKKDDRAVSLALACRAWEDRVRPKMIIGRRTKDAWEAQKSLSPKARVDLFTEFQLSTIFDRKAAERRVNQHMVVNRMYRDGWRHR